MELFFLQERASTIFMSAKAPHIPIFLDVWEYFFEQPSSRGLKQRVTGGELTFADSITNQFRASLSSIEGVAALKSKLLEYQRDHYASASKKSSKSSI